jgi:mycothiol system anti-sigma-R factor
MDCKRARASMFRVSDNELEGELLLIFREHLGRCPGCSHQFAYVSRLLALVRGRCSRFDAPATLRIRILSSFPHRGGVVLEQVD